MLLMCVTLYSLAHTSNRLLDAQQSQFAADATALGCVLVQKDLAQATIQIIAERNFAHIVETQIANDHCVTTVEVNRVVRRAVAVAADGFYLPTLQR